MDKDQKPQSPGEKPSDKKSPPQGGNLVWYMLGLGVLLLLMVAMFNSNSGVLLGFSELMQLVDASGPKGPGLHRRHGHQHRARAEDPHLRSQRRGRRKYAASRSRFRGNATSRSPPATERAKSSTPNSARRRRASISASIACRRIKACRSCSRRRDSNGRSPARRTSFSRTCRCCS